MKKSILTVLFGVGLTILGSQAQAHDGCYRDHEDRYSRYESYGLRNEVRYERPRYYYEDEPVVVRRRVVVDDDCDYRPRYSRHSHSYFRAFFGGF